MKRIFLVRLTRLVSIAWLYGIWVLLVKSNEDIYAYVISLIVYLFLAYLSNMASQTVVKYIVGLLYLSPLLIYLLLNIFTGYREHTFEVIIPISLLPIIWSLGNQVKREGIS